MSKLRLTKSKNNNYGDYELISNEFGSEEQEVINKLGQLEDLEEELGIDLITLFKALKDGIWYKDWANNIDLYSVRGIEKNGLSVIDRKCSYLECDILAYYKGYGKTWALTKEEL